MENQMKGGRKRRLGFGGFMQKGRNEVRHYIVIEEKKGDS